MLATITSKGQVTLPKAIREQLGLNEGTRLDFEVVNDMLQARAVGRTALGIAGALKQPGRTPVSLADMDRAIEQAAVARYQATETPPDEGR